MSIASTILQTTALSCALALPLHAQEQPAETPVTIWDAISFDNILTLVVQSFIPTLRVLADVRYAQIDVDSVRNRVALVGVDGSLNGIRIVRHPVTHGPVILH